MNLETVGSEFVHWTDLVLTGTSGGLQWTRWQAFGFHKMQLILWLAEELSFWRRKLAPWS